MKKENNIEGAKAVLERALKINSFPEVLTRLGIIYHNKQKYEEAIGNLNKALEIEPNHARAEIEPNHGIIWVLFIVILKILIKQKRII